MLGRLCTVLLLAALVAVALAASSSGQSPGPVSPGSPSPGGPAGSAPPGIEAAIAATQRHADELLDAPGVVGVGVGLDAAGHAVVRVYTDKPETVVSASLDGVRVERTVTGIIEARAPTDRFPRPVPIGVSSGLQQIATGTLGARVTNGTNVYALSNNHVFAGINTASVGDGIIQPGAADGGSDPADRIGTLAAYQTINFSGGDNLMDAAIALVSTATVGVATPPDGYGAPSSTTAQASIGQAVQKYGRTTGLQLGTVAATNVSVDVCYLLLFEFCLQEARFVGQISVSPGTFSAPGDSGSLIVTQGTNQPVALLFAGGDGLTIGTPIDVVLQRFGVTIDGQPPGDGPPSAPTGLAAVAGAGSVFLSWTTPSFDGNSPITGYKVYRGTSPGGEVLLDSVGVGTAYTDTAVTNGTTYYYKVSAENALGEGPQSNEASATPSDLVAPVEPLPTLDGFNRPDENPLSDAGRWSNGILNSGETGLVVSGNALACTRTTTCTGWRTNAQYGPDAETWARFATMPGNGNGLRLYVRMQQPGSSAVDGYVLRAVQQSGTDQVLLDRLDNGVLVNRLAVEEELAAGDTMLLRASGTTLEAWHHDGTTWSRLGTVADAAHSGAGFVGVSLRGTSGRLDDFGGRTMGDVPPPPEPPGAPLALAAQSGNSLVQLSWQPPDSDGGSPVTGYRVFRGTTPSDKSFLQTVGAGTTFTDTSVTNGTTYYYEVSAVNAVGEGPRSNEASATPTGLIPPVEPLLTLDGFDRPNESPLSDAGRWRNGILNSGESGLHVSSNALACSRSTTCTGWRQNALYGPDAETWVRVTTMPGNGNGLRLYVRMQQPGSSAVDGYVLRWTQQAGADQLLLDRLTNGAFTNRLTLASEIALGDTLLLRATGPLLEVWRRNGGGWTRLGFASDSTYAGAGYVGVALRGTSGRLDDFGAR
jgi:hypothetical protein